VTGKTKRRVDQIDDLLRPEGIATIVFTVATEPTVPLARDAMMLVAKERCDAVVAIGGGSALDAGKAIAALATNGGDPLDYLEVVGRGKAIEKPALPFIAIPTTAGTGSEVTKNAVLAEPETRVKASLRSPHMLPRVAIVDPDLLEGAPKDVLASSGLDALSQVIEPFLSARRNPITDAIAREGITRSIRSLRRAVREECGPAEREDLALASLCGGLCLANSGLGAVHGFAAPIGGSYEAPHGAVCAALLPAVLDTNLAALRARDAGSPIIARFDELARMVTRNENAGAEEGIAFLAKLVKDLAIPGLARYGMTENDVPTVAAKAKIASSMKANPITLTDEELESIARRSL
jgi:alcohol dehydrogenase class IV